MRKLLQTPAEVNTLWRLEVTKIYQIRSTAIALIALVVVVFPRPILKSPDEGKGWKGLVRLRSTRRDVEALLDPAATGRGSFYQTNEATVFVQYSDGPCEKGWPYGWNVDKDTVVSIAVSPKDCSDFIAEWLVSGDVRPHPTAHRLPH